MILALGIDKSMELRKELRKKSTSIWATDFDKDTKESKWKKRFSTNVTGQLDIHMQESEL